MLEDAGDYEVKAPLSAVIVLGAIVWLADHRWALAIGVVAGMLGVLIPSVIVAWAIS